MEAWWAVRMVDFCCGVGALLLSGSEVEAREGRRVVRREVVVEGLALF